VTKLFSVDSLKNFVAGLGTSRDKASSATYYTPEVGQVELINAYRGAWLSRKIVEIPALDATRKWRSWQADKDQISAIEAEENRLGLRNKIKEAITKARLFGGAGIYISIKGDRDPSLPLRPEAIKRGGIEFLNVMPARMLIAGEIESDPTSQNYGNPSHYKIASSGTEQKIHASRIARFIGAELPDQGFSGSNGWGDSVLTSSIASCKNYDATLANIASLVYEAKVDVIGIPGLTEIMDNPVSRNHLLERTGMVGIMKGINGTIVRDAEETYEQKTMSFSGLDKIAGIFTESAAGAADIPITRLFGQSPGGMNSSGESDIRNYYDRIQAHQELEITPAIHILDECLIRSALGDRPVEIFYNWNSLWQTTEKDRADIGKATADTIKTLADSQLFNADVLSKASENLLIERAIMPGLETTINEFAGQERNNDDPNAV
jgi:phage-related protein (TIGR01555 family)